MKHQTFIISSDKKYILQHYEKYIKFWDNCKILYVSNQNSHGLKKLKNVIICKDLHFNIEDKNDILKNYTAFFAVVKNNLIDDDTTHISFLQTDNTYEDDVQFYRNLLFEKLDSDVLVTNTMYISKFNNRPEYLFFLTKSISESRIESNIKTKDKIWCIGDQFFMKKDIFLEYFEWLDKTLDVTSWGYDSRAWYSIQRTLYIYCIIKKLKWDVIKQIKKTNF